MGLDNPADFGEFPAHVPTVAATALEKQSRVSFDVILAGWR